MSVRNRLLVCQVTYMIHANGFAILMRLPLTLASWLGMVFSCGIWLSAGPFIFICE